MTFTRNKKAIRKYFMDLEFVGTVNAGVFNDPFWLVDGDGIPLPFPTPEKGLDHLVNKYLQQVLPSYGFCSYFDGISYTPIHLKDGVAVEVDEKYIQHFISFAFRLMPFGNEILDNMSHVSGRFYGKRVLDTLRPVVDLDPLKDSRSTAYRFYSNGVVCVKADSVVFKKYSDIPSDSFVWADKINFRKFDPSLVENFDKDKFLSGEIGVGHEFYKWCVNLCKSRNDDGEWIFDNKKFRSLASGFGYLLHQYWNEYKCVILVDENLQEGEANGRTGKSVVLMDALSHALSTVVVDAGEIKKGKDNKFMFHFVEPSTQYISLDDSREDFEFSALFSKITGPLQAQKKYGGFHQFSKDEKPKMGLSTNHAVLGDGSSYTDRQHIVEVGEFYRWHKMEKLQDPSKFHGGWLFDDEWSDRNWQEFDSFCVNSLRYYLSYGLVGGKPSDNYQLKKLIQTVGSNELVDTLHRFLKENEDKTVYSKAVDGMSSDELSRCLLEYVEEHCPDENLSKKQLTINLRQVALHFGFYLNGGRKDRKQVRFGPLNVGVNSYLISRSMFSSSSDTTVSNPIKKVLAVVENDPVDKLEKAVKEDNPKLLEKPSRPVASTSKSMSDEEAYAYFEELASSD